MPRVKGFLRVLRRRPGGGPVDPDYGIDEGDGPVDPGWGVDEGDGDLSPDHPIVDPPPGVWPPLTPENPWRPIDPGWGVGFPDRPSTGPVPPGRPPVAGQPLPRPPGSPDQGLPGEGGGEAGQLPSLPPGMIWPPLPPGVHGKYLALVLIAGARGVRYHYTVIDASLRPSHPIAPGGGEEEAQPK